MCMNIKKTIAGILTIATLSGAVVVSLSKPEKLTYEEGLLIREIYNYEIQQQGGSVTFVNDENALDNLHDILLTRKIKATTTIRKQEFSSTSYGILRSGLFMKAEQKTLIEKILK